MTYYTQMRSDISKLIDEYGSTVTLSTQTHTLDMGGTSSSIASGTPTTETALVKRMNLTNELVQAGLYTTEDAEGWFKYDSAIVPEMWITADGYNYVVMSVNPSIIEGQVTFNRAMLKRRQTVM